MKVENYKDIEDLCKRYPDALIFHGPVGVEIMEQAEGVIGYKFPNEYHEFLSRYGGGYFGGLFPGLLGEDYLDDCPENTISNTKDRQENDNLPKHFLIVEEFGYDGGCAVLNLCPTDEGFGKVYEWFPFGGLNEEEPIADNFFAFLCDEIEAWLRDETEEFGPDEG